LARQAGRRFCGSGHGRDRRDQRLNRGYFEKTDGSRDCAPAFTFIDHFVAAVEAAVGTRADALDAIRPAIRHAWAWSLERERARAQSRREWRSLRIQIAQLKS